MHQPARGRRMSKGSPLPYEMHSTVTRWQASAAAKRDALIGKLSEPAFADTQPDIAAAGVETGTVHAITRVENVVQR